MAFIEDLTHPADLRAKAMEQLTKLLLIDEASKQRKGSKKRMTLATIRREQERAAKSALLEASHARKMEAAQRKLEAQVKVDRKEARQDLRQEPVKVPPPSVPPIDTTGNALGVE